jgi:hypothetical protein
VAEEELVLVALVPLELWQHAPMPTTSTVRHLRRQITERAGRAGTGSASMSWRKYSGGIYICATLWDVFRQGPLGRGSAERDEYEELEALCSGSVAGAGLGLSLRLTDCS